MDRRSLLCFHSFHLLASNFRVHARLYRTQISPRAVVCGPKSAEGLSSKGVFFDQLSNQQLYAGHIGQCCIFHQRKKMLLLILYAHMFVKVQVPVALDDSLLHVFFIRVYQREDLLHPILTEGEAILVQER